MIKKVAVAVALAVPLLGAATVAGVIAAGGSADADGTTSANHIANPTGVDTWTAKANEICAAADEEVDTLPAPGTHFELIRFLASLIEMNRRWNDDLVALGPPPHERKRFRALVKLMRDDERILDAMLAAAEAGDRDALSSRAAQYRSVDERQDPLWRAFGAERCTRPSFSPSAQPPGVSDQPIL